MGAPNVAITINDPGMGVVLPATSIPLVIGAATIGTNFLMKTYQSIPDLVAAHGQGQGVELAAHILALSGGPIRFMKSATSVASANGTVTKVAFSTSTGTITLGGTPSDDYELRIKITKTGANGVAAFQYSLDGGNTYSESITVPSGGTYLMPNSGITLTFVPGAGPIIHEAGDTHSADFVAAMMNSTDLGNAVTAMLADNTKYDFVAIAGKFATSSAGNTFFAALDTQLQALANKIRYLGAIMDAGKDADATTITTWTATSRRIAPMYGDERVASAKPFVGWGLPLRPSANAAAQRATSELISTDLARYKSGALGSVTAISYDEDKKATMDDAKFGTLRTFQGEEGFYITNVRLKSPTGSDFEFWQHRRIMDVACKTLYQAQLQFLSAGVRVNADGTIDERDAVRIEKEVTAKLEAVLTDPKNAEGTQGHVSAFGYRVSRTSQVLQTKTLASELAIRPLGYPKTITTVVGYATNVIQQAA